ncbi:QRFP-like peptide receptor [Porites lutea]|uniref:QRFP-like peptide receptor n=1 Tax=Porites lutea TaxID=51062 RepID=UPI003CC53C65
MEMLSEIQRNTSSPLDTYRQAIKFKRELDNYRKNLYSTSLVLLALGAAENIVVCLVLLKVSKSGRATQPNAKLSNFLLLQLAITDLVFRVLNVLRKTFENFWEISPEHCKTVIFTQFTCAAVTFELLSGIALDRYIHIIFPLRSLGLKPRKCLTMLLIWVYAMLICSGFIPSATVSVNIFNFLYKKRPFLNLTQNNVSNWRDIRHCTPGSAGSLERQIAFTTYFLLAFVVPLVCIIFSYTKITCFLWNKAKASNHVHRNIARAKLRAVRMCVFVVLSFIISWGPIMILDIIISYRYVHRRKKASGNLPLRPLFDCFSLTSSIFNPIIYAFCDASFRRNLRLLFCSRKTTRFEVNRISPSRDKINSPIQLSAFNRRDPRI